MQTIFMMVYNDIANDARVLRSAKALSEKYRVILFAVGCLEDPDITFLQVKNCAKIGGFKNFCRFVLGAVKNGWKTKPDFIYGHDIFSALPLNLLRLLRRKKKFVYDAHELFTKEENKTLSLEDRLLYHSEGKAIQCSDLVVCAHSRRAEIMVKYHSLSKRPVVVQNISYLNTCKEPLSPETEKDCEDFLQIPAFFVIYAGGILHGRRLDLLIDAVHSLGKHYKLLLVGNGPAFTALSQKILELRNPNLRMIQAVPYRQLGTLLEKADAGYLYYPVDTLNTLYCAPNKIFEYASIGLPIISNVNPTVREELQRYGIGVCDDQVDRAIVCAEAHMEEYKENMRCFLEQNSLNAEMKKLTDAVDQLYIQK